MVHKHLRVEEVDAGVEVHRRVARGHLEGRADPVEGGGADTRANRRGAERELDVVGVLDVVRVTELGVVVHELCIKQPGERGGGSGVRREVG